MKPVKITLVCLACLALAACSGAPGPAATPVTPAPTSAPTGAATPGAGASGAVSLVIDSVQVTLLDSSPVQVTASVRGSLLNNCTRIEQVTQTREGTTFHLAVQSKTSGGADCTKETLNFEEKVSLDVAGLPAGTYTVEASGKTGTFKLESGNTLTAGPATCPVAGEGTLLFNQDNRANGVSYCFLYPADFSTDPEAAPGTLALMGPNHGSESEPIRAELTLVTQDAGGQSLEEIISALMTGNGQGLKTQRSGAGLGGEGAYVIEGLPDPIPSRTLIVVHKGLVYTLSFSPLGGGAQFQANADMERLYQTLTSTWVFPG